jgi:hypothetical protein
MILRILVLWLFLYCSYSKANCLPDVEGLCTPGVTITEDTQIDITEEDKGTEIITTTTTTVTTSTTTITNEDSGDILTGSNGYVSSNKEGDMDIDWGGQGGANMPTGNSCYGLGADKCAQITGGGNSTSTMGVAGMGTTFINTVDISDLQIDNGGEVKYTIEVDKQDAQDRIYMHVSGFNGTTSVFSGTDILSESGVSTGYQSYNGSFNFSGILNKIIVEVGGRDINLAVGPLFDDVSVNVFYNVINTIITQQITTLEEIYYLDLFTTSEIDFAQEVFEFNDVTVDDGMVDFSPIEPETEEVSFETVELEIDLEMSFDVEFTPPAPMEMLPPPEMEIPVNIETVEAEIQMELEELPEPEMIASVEEMPEPEISAPEPEPEETAPEIEEIKEEPEMVEPEPEEETTEESQEEPQESEQKEPQPEEKEKDPEEKPKEEKSSKPKITKKEKAATKIVKKIDDKARYDDAAQMKTLIVMQILSNTQSFFDSQATIVDTNVNEYLNKTIEDQYGILFNMAQENTISEMIDAQY